MSMTIISMAHAAVQAVVCPPSFNACFCVLGARRISVEACAVNQETLGPISQPRFNRTGFLQGRQAEMHHGNPDQYQASRKHCPMIRECIRFFSTQVPNCGVHSSSLQLRERKENMSSSKRSEDPEAVSDVGPR